jgi:prepilin-type N-terminal cleavage/methylation domain-containing protein
LTTLRTHRERGFTLIELMISMTLFSIVVAGIMAVASTLTSGFRLQRKTVASESAARNSLDFIADAIRSGSPAVASGNIQVASEDCPPTAEPVEVVDNEGAPDELTITFARGSFVTSTRAVYGPGVNTLQVEDFDQLQRGDTLLISDMDRGVLVTIDQPVSSNTIQLVAQGCTSLTFPGSGYPARSLVVRATRARFFVEPLDGTPALWMDPDAEGPALAEPLSEGIEDMQVVYDPAQHSISITLVARDKPGDPARILSTAVQIRNLEGSP